MEQSQINKLTIGGVVVSVVVALVALGLVITLFVRDMRSDSAPTVSSSLVTEEPVLNIRGFVGKPTANGLRTEGATKILELKGHILDKEIPGYEPVNDSDTAVHVVRIDAQTKITKITSAPGKAPSIEELSVGEFTAAASDLVYLARYEAMAKDVPMNAPVAFLEIYSLPKVKGVQEKGR